MPAPTSTVLADIATVFLGILLEASPFLLADVLLASFLEAAAPVRLARWAPRHPLLALLGGAAAGLCLPLCECGTVPVARGSVARGTPLPAAVAFLLAAPVINPVTIAATYTAFAHDARMVVLRLALGVGIALAVGAVFLSWPRGESPLRPARDERLPASCQAHRGAVAVLAHAAGEFARLQVYLVVAALCAALLQVCLPRTLLLSLGHDPLRSVALMLVVALVLSTCSSVDAFVALAFSTTVAPGAILAFLLASPVLNLKSGALVLALFRPTVSGPLLGTATATLAVAGLAVNYHLL